MLRKSKSYDYDYKTVHYCRNNKLWKEALSVDNASYSSMFDRTRETKLIIHDYNQSASDPMLIKLKNGNLH